MQLIETVKGAQHLVKVYFGKCNKGIERYTVVPCTRMELTGYEYPVSGKIKSFNGREAADHYVKQL